MKKEEITPEFVNKKRLEKAEKSLSDMMKEIEPFIKKRMVKIPTPGDWKPSNYFIRNK